MIVDYSVLGTDGRARFGTVRAIFDGSSIVIDETSTTDLNNPTFHVTFSGSVGGGNASIRIDNASGSGYDAEVKAFINMIER
jgi:hypothetical protein